MPEDLILAHDVGTSGTKSSLMDSLGMLLDSVASEHRTHYGPGGVAEQDPEDWWSGVRSNTRALIERHPEFRSRVAGIGVSGQMLGCLAVGADGEPLRPHMIHSDSRAGQEMELVREAVGAEAVYRTSGNVLDPRSPLCKMLWLKANEPEVYTGAARFLQAKDFIVGRMTGSFETTDYSDAAHAHWMDIRKQALARELVTELGLDPEKLPEPHGSTEVVGTLCGRAADALGLPDGIPVVAGGGDGSCASVGAGAVLTGDIYCCIGTTAWIASVADEPFIDERMRVFNLPSLDGRNCAVFGTVQAAGRSLDWAMELLGEEDFSRLDELLAAVPAGSDGLIFLPYLEGERSPIYDANARGVFFGIGPTHGREHFLRATVEGVSFALRSVLEVIRERRTVEVLRLIGGGGQSAVWRQMVADICCVETQELSTDAADATSIGAAVAAGVGVGMFDDLAEGTENINIGRRRKPDPELRETYDRQFELYDSLYPALKPAFARLQSS
ncbi:MAG: FGGY-family carbohydrate kinase [Candidatus Brocadiia bacterium]